MSNALRKTQSELLISSAQNRFPQFQPKELEQFAKQFRAFDKNGNGRIDSTDLLHVVRELGESTSILNDSHGQLNTTTLTFDDFLECMIRLRDGQSPFPERGFGAVYQKKVAKLVKLSGATDATTHSINEEEQQQFSIHINNALGNDKDLKHKLPINLIEFEDIYQKCADGLILSKLINHSVPETIDERVLNKGQKLNPFQMTENNNVVINSAKAIGCSVVNIGSQDLIEGRHHLVMGLVWQIIKMGLFSKVDLLHHPELFRLLEKGETLEDLLKLSTDQILLRWFNYHLKKANWNRTVNNFSTDIKDGENYTILLNQLAPETCSRAPLQEQDLMERAEMVLKNAEKLNCRQFVTAKAIVDGNPKLNLAFVANLFNTCPGLEPLSETEKAALDEWLFNSAGDREARAFALWLNSLGIEPFVNNLYEDLRNGLVLLRAMDKVHPGCVNWTKVNTKMPLIRFKMVENTNYAVVLGHSFKYSLVGIQGADITDGNKKLTLALVWQLMRDNVIQILKTLSNDGKDIKDEDMIKWANSAPARVGKKSTMSSFKDPSLRSGHFFLDVLSGIKKGIVDYALVTDGVSDDNAKMNAKYAISIARKLGATIFLLPEDIVEVKPKMILTFVGALMALDRQVQGQA